MSDVTIQLLIAMVTAALGVLGKYYETKKRNQVRNISQSDEDVEPDLHRESADESLDNDSYNYSESDPQRVTFQVESALEQTDEEYDDE